jgi:predicted nucleic acid binding AN1-type Zn finger protein
MTVSNAVEVSDADLLSVGRHCAHADCHQLDFLPFHCQGCQKSFCLEHRQPSAHACPNPPTAQAERESLLCPLCARAVVLQPGEDPNAAFERHNRTAGECDPTNYARVHKKPRCPVQGCREKITAINSYLCKDCGATVCLKHRLGTDHGCPGPQAMRAKATGLRASLAGFLGLVGDSEASSHIPESSTASRGGHASKSRFRRSKAAAQAAATAASQRSQLAAYRSGHRLRSASRDGPPSSVGAEVCHCGASFRTVQELIDHASAAHQEGWSSGEGLAVRPGEADGVERCPHCGIRCDTAVSLVTHVETCRAKPKSPEVCVIL